MIYAHDTGSAHVSQSFDHFPLFKPSTPSALDREAHEAFHVDLPDYSLDNRIITGHEEVEPAAADAVLTFGPGGVIVKQAWFGIPPFGGGSRRGAIRGFSRSSRRRLMRKSAMVDWSACPTYFVTLTYHDDFPVDYRDGTADLKAWRKRLDRAFGRMFGSSFVGALWRREWVQRKSGAFMGHWVQHFHVILLMEKELGPRVVELLCSMVWHTIVAPGDAAHTDHGCHVQRVFNARGSKVGKLMGYLSKYVSKVPGVAPVNLDTGECLDVGRSWGIWGTLPDGSWSVAGSRATLVAFLRRLRRWSDNDYAKRLTDRWLGFLLFGDGRAMHSLLRGLTVADVG